MVAPEAQGAAFFTSSNVGLIIPFQCEAAGIDPSPCPKERTMIATRCAGSRRSFASDFRFGRESPDCIVLKGLAFDIDHPG